MTRALNFEDMCNTAQKFGGLCLSSEYKNAKTKLKWQCKNGHEFYALPLNILRGHWCPTCANRPHLNIDHFRKIAMRHNGVCLSNDYLNNKTRLTFKCKENHTWTTSAQKIRTGTWCPICAGNKPLTIEQIKFKAESLHGKLISTHYLGSKNKLMFICCKGHKFSMTPAMVNAGRWCPDCKKPKKLTIEMMQEIAASRKGLCLSSKYCDRAHPLLWKCSYGHEWQARAADIRKGQWCPICHRKIGESVARQIFEKMFQTKFLPTIKLSWLINSRAHRLELDGYSPVYNLAFEYQGEQHYSKHKLYHRDSKEFILRKKDDEWKRMLCRSNGVLLIEIPYFLKYDKIQTYIYKKCKKYGITIPNTEKIQINTLDNYHNPVIDRIRDDVSKINSELVSTYINSKTPILIKCRSCGNTRYVRIDHIREGHGCQFCNKNR